MLFLYISFNDCHIMVMVSKYVHQVHKVTNGYATVYLYFIQNESKRVKLVNIIYHLVFWVVSTDQEPLLSLKLQNLMQQILFLGIQSLCAKSEHKNDKLGLVPLLVVVTPIVATSSYTYSSHLSKVKPACANWGNPVSCSSPAATWSSLYTSWHPPQSFHLGELQ